MQWAICLSLIFKALGIWSWVLEVCKKTAVVKGRKTWNWDAERWTWVGAKRQFPKLADKSYGLLKTRLSTWHFPLHVQLFTRVWLCCGIFWPEFEPMPPTLEVQHPNYWTTREVPCIWLLIQNIKRASPAGLGPELGCKCEPTNQFNLPLSNLGQRTNKLKWYT